MTEKYMDRFKMTELFDKNNYQEIQMATNQSDSNTIAVINTLYNTTGLGESFLNQARSGLKGLIHSELNSDALVLVTHHCDGVPLADWLKTAPSLTEDQLFQFTHDYMNQILSYDQFSPYFSAMLADSSQIVMKDHQLCMSEMIFIDDRITPFAVPTTPFSTVREKVKEVFQLCISAQANPNGRFSLTTTPFIEKTIDHADSLLDLQKLWTAAQQEDLEKTQQIMTPIVPTTETPLKPEENETLIELEALQERQPANRTPVSLFLLAAAVILVLAGLILWPKLNAKVAPVASYTWVKQADGVLKFTNTSQVSGNKNNVSTSEWKIYSADKEIYTCSSFNMAIGLKTSGDYKVALRVMDNNKLWSKSYAETISYEAVKLVPLKDSDISNGDENLNNFKIHFDTPNIFEDNQVFNTGSKSLRLELGKDGKATFTLKELTSPSNYVISLWMKTSQLGQFDMSFNGLKNGHSRFTEHLQLNPESTEAWQMVELRIANKDIDGLTITLKGSGNVWLDDFQIGEIK